MGFYIAKLKWLQPKEETDELQKMSKSFLVKALSITEVEANIAAWLSTQPSTTYQDIETTGVQESKIIDFIHESDSETFWEAKLGDENEKGKIVPFTLVISGDHHHEVIKSLDKKYNMSQFLAIKKINIIVEDDLIAEPVETKIP